MSDSDELVLKAAIEYQELRCRPDLTIQDAMKIDPVNQDLICLYSNLIHLSTMVKTNLSPLDNLQ